MNVDKIKWMVDYAAEYEITGDRITYRGSWDCIGNIQVSPLYPLLLTRIIEGINVYLHRKYNEQYEIVILHRFHPIENKYMWFWNVGYDFNDFEDTPDKAKQAAIDYVYEQESNK